MHRDCPNAPNAWGAVGGVQFRVLSILLPLRYTWLLPLRSPLRPCSRNLVPSFLPLPRLLLLNCVTRALPVSPSPQSQSTLTGLVAPALESSNGAFSSSASVLSDPDSIDSFLTQVDNDNCMNMDIHDTIVILLRVLLKVILITVMMFILNLVIVWYLVVKASGSGSPGGQV